MNNAKHRHFKDGRPFGVVRELPRELVAQLRSTAEQLELDPDDLVAYAMTLAAKERGQ